MYMPMTPTHEKFTMRTIVRFADSSAANAKVRVMSTPYLVLSAGVRCVVLAVVATLINVACGGWVGG